jgi:hypothetical protein
MSSGDLDPTNTEKAVVIECDLKTLYLTSRDALCSFYSCEQVLPCCVCVTISLRYDVASKQWHKSMTVIKVLQKLNGFWYFNFMTGVQVARQPFAQGAMRSAYKVCRFTNKRVVF